MKTTATATVKLTIKGIEHELTLDEAREVMRAIENIIPKPLIERYLRDFRPTYLHHNPNPFKENDIVCHAKQH